MATRIDVQPVDESLVAEIVDVSRRHYVDEDITQTGHVAWKHHANPAGASLALRLLDDDRPVGRIAMQRRRWVVEGHDVVAGNPADLLIDEEHRTMQRFVQLFRSMRKVDGLSFLYHTSNPTTDPLYRTLLKLEVVTQLDGFVVPVRPSRPIAQRLHRPRVLFRALDPVAGALLALARGVLGPLTRVRAHPLLPADSEVDAALARFTARQRVVAARDARFVRWRFREDPLRPHTVLAVERRGRFLGYVALRRVELAGLRFTVVIDLALADRLRAPDRLALVAALCGVARRDGSDALFGMANAANADLGRFFRFPFLRVPDEAMPQLTPIFTYAFDEVGERVALRPDAYLTLADLDLL
jgi:hypothetical protein